MIRGRRSALMPIGHGWRLDIEPDTAFAGGHPLML